MSQPEELVRLDLSSGKRPIESEYWEHTFIALGHVLVVVNEIRPEELMHSKAQGGSMETVIETPQGKATGFIDLRAVPFILSKPFYGKDPKWPTLINPRDEGRI